MANGSYMLLSLSIEGRAKVGRIRHDAPDGRTDIREYAWPIEITTEQLRTVLADLHRRWLAEPPMPAPLDPAMDLVGKAIVVES